MWNTASNFPLRKFVRFASHFPKWRGYQAWSFKRAALAIDARLRRELSSRQLSHLASMSPLQLKRFVAASNNHTLWKNELLYELYQLKLKYELFEFAYGDKNGSHQRLAI